MTDEESVGQPVMSQMDKNIAKIRQIVCANRRLTMRSIADQMNIDRKTVRKVLLEDLGMCKVLSLIHI